MILNMAQRKPFSKITTFEKKGCGLRTVLNMDQLQCQDHDIKMHIFMYRYTFMHQLLCLCNTGTLIVDSIFITYNGGLLQKP